MNSAALVSGSKSCRFRSSNVAFTMRTLRSKPSAFAPRYVTWPLMYHRPFEIDTRVERAAAFVAGATTSRQSTTTLAMVDIGEFMESQSEKNFAAVHPEKDEPENEQDSDAFEHR